MPMLMWAVGALAARRLSPTMSTLSCASHLSGKRGGWYVLLQTYKDGFGGRIPRSSGPPSVPGVSHHEQKTM
jgi:hypothetical protein